MADPFQGLSSLGGAATRYFNRSRKDPLERLIREMQNQQQLQRLQHEGRRLNVQATQNVTNDGYIEALQMPVVNPDDPLLSAYQQAPEGIDPIHSEFAERSYDYELQQLLDENQSKNAQLANDAGLFDEQAKFAENLLNTSMDPNLEAPQGIADNIAMQDEFLQEQALLREQEQGLLEQQALLGEQNAAVADQAQRYSDYQDQIAAAQSDVLSAPLASQQEILARIVADPGAFPSVDQSFEDSLTLNAGDRVNQARVVNEFTRTLQDQEGGATPEQLQFAARNKPALIAELQRRAYNDPEFYKKNRALFDKIGVKPVAGTATATAQGKAEQTEVINMLQGGVVTPELEKLATENPQLLRSALASISTDNLNPRVTRFLQQKLALGNPKGAKATKELPDRYQGELLNPDIPFSEGFLQFARENPGFARDAKDRYILVGEKKNQLIAAANLKVDTPARIASGKKLTANEISTLGKPDVMEVLDEMPIDKVLAIADKNPDLIKSVGLTTAISKAAGVANARNALVAAEGMSQFTSGFDGEFQKQAAESVTKRFGEEAVNIMSTMTIKDGVGPGNIDVKFQKDGAEQLAQIAVEKLGIESLNTTDELNENLSNLDKKIIDDWKPLVTSAKSEANKKTILAQRDLMRSKAEEIAVQESLDFLEEDIKQRLIDQLKIDTGDIYDFETHYGNIWAERSRGFTTREDLETFEADVRDQWANK